MKMLRSCFVAAIALTIPLGIPQTAPQIATVTVKGHVVDTQGRPVVGAQLATRSPFLNNYGHRPDLVVDKIGATDRQGDFEVPVTLITEPSMLVVMDDARKLGAMVEINRDVAAKSLSITLEPVATVKMTIQAAGQPNLPVYVAVKKRKLDSKFDPKSLQGMAAGFLGSVSASGESTFVVPPGDYTLTWKSDFIEQSHRDVKLKPGQEVDLGRVPLQLSTLGKHLGKPLENWDICESRVLDKSAKLSDLKGKWVLMYFWAWWCGPCVRKSLPECIEIYDKFKDKRDKFEIVAYHSHSATVDLADSDKKLQTAITQYWGGKNLPFPVVLGSENDKTWKTWGVPDVRSFLLINPEGNLVPGDVETLRDILSKMD